MTTPCIKQINRALARAGVGERLTRSPAGYYYLIFSKDGPLIECSIYSFRLDPEDYDFAAGEINDAFRRKGLAAPLTLRNPETRQEQHLTRSAAACFNPSVVPFRSSTDSDRSHTMKTLMNGQPVEVLNHAKGWFSVKTADGKTQSVRRAALDFVSDAPTDSAEQQQVTEQAAAPAAQAAEPNVKEATMKTTKTKSAKPTKSAAKKPAAKTKKTKAAKPAAKKAAKTTTKSTTVAGAAVRVIDGKEYTYQVAGKTAGGNVAYDNGDEVAAKLRGKTLDEVYTITAKAMLKKGDLKGDFAKCETVEQVERKLKAGLKEANPGRARMTLGNRLRAALKVAA